jgi:Fe2+ transport system protein B
VRRTGASKHRVYALVPKCMPDIAELMFVMTTRMKWLLLAFVISIVLWGLIILWITSFFS